MKRVATGVALVLLLAAASCAPKRPAPQPPPPAPQSVVALLPEPDGTAGEIVVRNQAGTQALNQPNQAVRLVRNDTPPSAPYLLTAEEVRRLFGSAIDVLPEPEILFVLHFDENRDVLTAESQALIPAILNAVTQRHSTSISVTGHTDTTATPEYNYALGLRRAQNVENVLLTNGVSAGNVFVSSHGDTDLVVKTGRGVAEPRNRRVEVIVR